MICLIALSAVILSVPGNLGILLLSDGLFLLDLGVIGRSCFGALAWGWRVELKKCKNFLFFNET